MGYAGAIRSIDLEVDPNPGSHVNDAYIIGDYLYDNGNSFYLSKTGVGSNPAIQYWGSAARAGTHVLNVYLPSDSGSVNTRTEVVTVPTINFGDLFYHGFSIYVPYTGFTAPTSWEAFGQFWQHPDVAPPLALEFVANSDPLEYRIVYRNDTGFYEIYRGEMPRGEWVDFIVRAKFSTSSGDIKVWQDYGVVAEYTGKLGFSGKGTTVTAKVGLYREAGQTITQSVFFDQIKYGTTFDDADPNR